MKVEMGEYLVGAYLQIVENCDFVNYNVRSPAKGLEGLAEFDVVGINFKENHLFLHYPTLPPFLQEVWIQNLKLKKGKVDLHFKRYEKDVVVNVLNKEGDVKIFIEK